MKQRLDVRTLMIMLAATLVGAAWAYYNFTSTGGERGEDQLRPLVWTIFSTPFVLFLGWVLARKAELWLAAFICFCVYFFTPFVAASIESLFRTTEEAAHTGHTLYFTMVMVLHTVLGVGLSVWRSMVSPKPATPQDEESSDSAAVGVPAEQG
jgi:cytochrome bd-type quinol oxidase subunit 2